MVKIAMFEIWRNISIRRQRFALASGELDSLHTDLVSRSVFFIPRTKYLLKVCYRGLLTTLLCTSYESKEGWEVTAARWRGTIYLRQQVSCQTKLLSGCGKKQFLFLEQETEERRRQRERETDRQKTMSSWG